MVELHLPHFKTCPLQTPPKAGTDGTSQNAGRVMGEEGRRNRSLRCHKELKNVLRRHQEVYGPTKPRTTPLLSADGSTLLTEKSSINARCREHLSTLLNRPSTVDPTVLNQIPQKPLISLDPPPPHPLAPPPPPQRLMKFRRRPDRPARENHLGWTGFLQRSSGQQVQWPSKHSAHSTPASGK